MFLNDQTIKFIAKRDSFLRTNLKSAEDLSDYDLKKIAESAGVSLDIVLEDAKAFDFDIRTHEPHM